MDLSGFNPSRGFGGDLNAPAATMTQPRSPGILSRLVGGVTAAPKYFLNTDIINPAKELAAQATGNKQAYANAEKAQQNTIGNTPGEAAKRLAGNTAQLATLVLAPEAKAGLTAKVAQGAKVGAVAGAGSAAANDQNILKGAGLGAVTGGIAEPVASSILSKVLPKDSVPGATGKPSSLTNRVASNLKMHLQQTEAHVGGFNAGAKLPGAAPEGISLAESQRLTDLADKHGIPAGSPTTRLHAVQGKLSDATANLHNTIADNNVPVTGNDLQNIADEFNQRVSAQPNADELRAKADTLSNHLTGGETPSIGGQKLTPAQAKQLGVNSAGESTVKDLQGLNQYRQKLDGIINYSRRAGSPNPVGEQAATILRQTISDHIGNMAPEVSGANATYSELKALEAPLLEANNKVMNSGGGFYNRLFNNNVTKGAESIAAKAGRNVLGKVENATSGTVPSPSVARPGILSKLTSKATPEATSAVTRAATVAPSAAVGAASPQLSEVSSSGQPSSQNAAGQAQSQDVLGFAGPIQNQGTDANDPFGADSIKNLILRDVQQTGGKNVSSLISLYNTFGKPSATQSTTERNTVDSLNSALSTLQAYNDQLNAAGGGQSGLGRVKEITGNIPVVGRVGNASATAAVGSQAVDVATAIAKALTGGKPSSAQIKSWQRSIPLPTDTPEVAKQKMQNITDSINAKLQTLGAGTQ